LSITFPAAYSARLHSSSIEIDWLFHFVNDNAGVVYLASKDRTVGGNRYYGVIEDSGEITRELDLLNCVASVGELSISCADVYKTGTLSGELLHNGADYYINQEVKIYECANNDSTLSNCPLLYEGRLKEIDIQGNGVVLVIEQWTPFDHITIPLNKATNASGVYQPVAYGSLALTAAGFPTSREAIPARFFNQLMATRHYAISRDSAAAVGLYEPAIDAYVRIIEDATLTETQGIDGVNLKLNAIRIFNHRPVDYDHSDYDDTNEWVTGPNQGFNGETGNYCQSVTLSTTVGEETEDTDYVLLVPQIKGFWYDYTIYVYNVITVTTADADGDNNAELLVSIDEGSTWHQINARSTPGATSAAWDNTGDIDADITDGVQPKTIIIRLKNTATGSSGSVVSYGRVMDVYIAGSVKWTKDDPDHQELFTRVEVAYSTSTLLKSYSGAEATVANEVHMMHRDLMARYAGVDYADAQMKNWSDLDTARSTWDVKAWVTEPTSLKEVIEKVQFEGCFIFMLVADSDGSGTVGGRYIWVKDTYDAGDVVQTFNEDDYTNFSIGHTDIYEVITRTKYNYLREPRNNAYQKQEDYNNTTDRDLWNLGTDHYEEIDLDYLVQCSNGTDDIYDGDTTPNESICLYRDNIQSEPKMLVGCEITNKKKCNIEYGDIVKFNDSNVLPYGEDWANLYFMVISERRNKTGVSITAKEVYRA